MEGNYSLDTFDYVQMPLALFIGALNVMDDTSNGFKCSRNITTARTQIKEAFKYFNSSDDLEAFTAIHLAGAEIDDIGLNCYFTFTNDLTSTHFEELFTPWPKNLLLNFLYNAGHMWVDAVNYMFYTP